jgi:hypothetical protein
MHQWQTLERLARNDFIDLMSGSLNDVREVGRPPSFRVELFLKNLAGLNGSEWAQPGFHFDLRCLTPGTSLVVCDVALHGRIQGVDLLLRDLLCLV